MGHLKNLFSESEINHNSTTKDFLVVQKEGSREVKRNDKHYNLDAIIAVGYRVNSERTTAFRQWAIKTLRDFTLHVCNRNGLRQRFAHNKRFLRKSEE
jgi:hypothetical protein